MHFLTSSLRHHQGRLEDIFKQNAKYRRFWNVIKKNDAKLDPESHSRVQFERTFLSKHIKKYFKILDSIPKSGTLMDSEIM